MSVSNYKEFVAALATGGKIELDPDVTIIITASTRIPRSNTRITSKDPKRPGTLKLQSAAGWSGPLLYGNNLTGLQFDNFIINGNFTEQGAKPRGRGHFSLCNLLRCDDIKVNNMYMHNGGNDGFQFRSCRNIEVHDNKIEYLGHDAFYFINRCSNIEVFNNDVLIFTNSAVRLSYGCTNAYIHNNYFHGVFTGGSTGPAIEIDKAGQSGILISNNIIENTNGAGIWMLSDSLNKGSIVISDCVFKNTGVYKNYTQYSNAAIVNGSMDGAVIKNCTFIDGAVAYSTFDYYGVNAKFHVKFINCLFVNAKTAVFRMADSGGSLEATNCNFYNNGKLISDRFATLAKITNSSTINPMLGKDFKIGESSGLYGKGIGYAATVVTQPAPEPTPDPIPNKLVRDCNCRLRQASPNSVYANSLYLDVGRSTAVTRSLLYFNLDKYTKPVYKAELQLCWYYPADKQRSNDTIVEIYRPAGWTDNTATWNKNADAFYDATDKLSGTKPFASRSFSSRLLPDNKFHTFDVTQLVNAYIDGTYQNTGFMLKSALESNNYIAFYGMFASNVAVQPKLVLTTEQPIVEVFVPITNSRRFREANKSIIFDKNIYYDVGKSVGSARAHVEFSLSKFTIPVESAHLMLAWYYPSGKVRIADTEVGVYYPKTKMPTFGTWNTDANNYDSTKLYGSALIKNRVLPDGKYEAIDITELVNEYITGKKVNNGLFIKAVEEGNNYIAFHGDCAIEPNVKPYILIKTKEAL